MERLDGDRRVFGAVFQRIMRPPGLRAVNRDCIISWGVKLMIGINHQSRVD